MRVLMLSWEYPPIVYGGLGRHVHALAEALVTRGNEVTVVTQHATGAERDEVIGGVRVVRVPEDPPLVARDDLLGWVLAFNHALARTGTRLAHELAPDVVHAHDWVVGHAAAAVKESVTLPLVATVHATEAGRHQGWLPSPLSRSIHTTEWWLTFEARRVITCSAYMQWEVTRLFDLPAGKVDVVPNAIDAGAWSVPARQRTAARTRWAGTDDHLVVYAGRLEYEKGVHTLLRSLARLRRRRSDVRLVVAGTGTYETELRALARKLRLGRAVVFAGHLGQTDLAALTAAADTVVVPSVYEPFGMVALEAAAVGTPLVVADSGGLRETVAHGVTGLRFPPEDVTALASALDAVFTDQLDARRRARRARRALSSTYTWPVVASQTADVYTRAIEEEGALQADLTARIRPLRVVVKDGNLLTGTDTDQ